MLRSGHLLIKRNRLEIQDISSILALTLFCISISIKSGLGGWMYRRRRGVGINLQKFSWRKASHLQSFGFKTRKHIYNLPLPLTPPSLGATSKKWKKVVVLGCAHCTSPPPPPAKSVVVKQPLMLGYFLFKSPFIKMTSSKIYNFPVFVQKVSLTTYL